MVETALAQALHKAGVKSPADRLHEIALKAMVAHADDTNATIEQIWSEVQEDRRLMITLFALDYRRSIGALLYRVRSNIAYQANYGELKRPIERKAAKVVALLRGLDAKVEADHRREEAAHRAKQDQEYQDYLASWKKTQIGNLEISGKPVWEVSAGTVRAWLATEQRRWRTVELLIEGLPDDGRPISYYRRPDEVAAAWQAAGGD